MDARIRSLIVAIIAIVALVWLIGILFGAIHTHVG
jgi:hypothetical protein